MRRKQAATWQIDTEAVLHMTRIVICLPAIRCDISSKLNYTCWRQETTYIMLTGKQKRHLRALGHKLKPLIQIGKKEIEDALIVEANIALDHHELLKVRILESCLLDKHEASDMLAKACDAEVAQILGKTFLLYRPAKKPVIIFPQPGKPAQNETT